MLFSIFEAIKLDRWNFATMTFIIWMTINIIFSNIKHNLIHPRWKRSGGNLRNRPVSPARYKCSSLCYLLCENTSFFGSSTFRFYLFLYSAFSYFKYIDDLKFNYLTSIITAFFGLIERPISNSLPQLVEEKWSEKLLNAIKSCHNRKSHWLCQSPTVRFFNEECNRFRRRE